MKLSYLSAALISLGGIAAANAQNNAASAATPAPAVESSPALDDRGELLPGGSSMGQRGSSSATIGQRGSTGSNPAATVTTPSPSSIVSPNQGGMSTGSSATQSGNIIPSPNTPSTITPDEALRNRSSNLGTGGIRTESSIDGGMR